MPIKDNKNLKQKCKYYPCHDLDDENFDCRTCYCPIYNICSAKQNNIFGGYLLNKKVWACENCNFIHRKDVVEEIIKMQNENFDDKKIYNRLINY